MDEMRQRTALTMFAGERRIIESGGAAFKTEIKKEVSVDDECSWTAFRTGPSGQYECCERL